MRIGLDGRGIRPEPDGIGRYTQQLIRSVVAAFPDSEMVVWCLSSGLSSVPSLPQIRSIVCNHHHLTRFTVQRFGKQINAAELDLFHSPFFLAPVMTRCPLLVTVHDLMALEIPEFFDESSPLVAWYKRSFHRRYVPRSLQAAYRVLPVSRWVAQRVEAQGVRRENIRILPNAVDILFSNTSTGSDVENLRSLGLRPGFFLHVGRWKRYKNLPLLLEAYQRYIARTSREPIDLVLCRGGGGDRRVEMVLDRLQLRDRVKIVQQVPDRLLPTLYRAASAVLQPSLCEGFGLPVVEAMACGTPAVCSDAGALPEVCGDAALIVDSTSSEAWAAALEQLASDQDLRSQLRSKGIGHSAIYRPEQMTKNIAAIYKEVVQ
ncbi:MAG: glycosyltransferase family 1 protein [bacterium]